MEGPFPDFRTDKGLEREQEREKGSETRSFVDVKPSI